MNLPFWARYCLWVGAMAGIMSWLLSMTWVYRGRGGLLAVFYIVFHTGFGEGQVPHIGSPEVDAAYRVRWLRLSLALWPACAAFMAILDWFSPWVPR